MNRRRQPAPWIVLLVLWLLGTALGLITLVRSGPTPIPLHDERVYLTIAHNLRSGHGFCSAPGYQRSWRPPLLPLALAGFGTLGLDPAVAARVVNALLAGGICALIFLLGMRAFGRTVGLAAGVLAAVYPPLHEYTRLVLTEVPFTFLVALAAWLHLRPASHSPRKRALACGAVLGLAALLRPVALVLLLVLAVHDWAALRTPGRQAALRLGLMAAASLAVISPWTVRNAVVHHRFVLLTTNGGFNLLAGNLTGYAADYDRLLTAQERDALRTASEVERDRLFYRYAWRRFRQRPWAQLRLVVQKSARAWFGPDFFVGWVDRRAHEVALVGLSVVGLAWALAGRNRAAWLFLLLVLYFNALAAVFFPDLRYRFPAFPYLLLFAVLGVASAARSALRRPVQSSDQPPDAI